MQIIGRGRYARETYPISAGAAGAGAAFAPLSRQRFIDGGTTQTGLDGSIKDPYATIAQFIAARLADNTSIANATATFVGWLMPTPAGAYGEAIAFPPYASSELRADSFSLAGGGVSTIGNVTWANIAGAFAATAASVTIHNITVFGNITITDDAGAPDSVFAFSCDEAREGAIFGQFDSSTTTRLLTVLFFNTFISDSVLCGLTANSADVILAGSRVQAGTITARNITSWDSQFSNVTAISAQSTAVFNNSVFLAADPVLTVPTATFDGTSWLSFLNAGGTRGGATTVVLVPGGYNIASVPGAALTDADVTVTLNGTGATAGFTGSNSGNHYTSSVVLTGNRAVTIETDGAEAGDTMCISRTSAADAFTLSVINGGPGAGTIGVIPVSSKGFVVARFDGTNWIFAEGGSLAA